MKQLLLCVFDIVKIQKIEEENILYLLNSIKNSATLGYICVCRVTTCL